MHLLFKIYYFKSWKTPALSLLCPPDTSSPVCHPIISLHTIIQSCNMAPSQDLPAQTTQENGHTNGHSKKQEFVTQPSELGGHLKEYRSFKSTPIIGTEFPEASLAEWLTASNSDDLIRDLAITSKCQPATVRSPNKLTLDSIPPRCSLFPLPGRSHGRTPERARPSSRQTDRQTRIVVPTHSSPLQLQRGQGSAHQHHHNRQSGQPCRRPLEEQTGRHQKCVAYRCWLRAKPPGLLDPETDEAAQVGRR